MSLPQKTIALALLLGIGSGFPVRGAGETILPTATNLWKFPLTTAHQGFPSSAAPALSPDGTIYQATFEGSLIAISPDGREKWRFNAGLEIKSAPSIADDGTIYFGSRDRKCHALTPDGKAKWTFATGGWVDATPAIAQDGTICFGSWDTFFYALKPDGTVKWKYPAGAIIEAPAAIGRDGAIYFGAHDKYFYALNPDGSVRWKFLTGGEIVAASAIGSGGEIYFSSLDGRLYALNPDGTERWHLRTGSTTRSAPVLDEAGNLCLGHTNCTIVVAKDGSRSWHSGSPLPINVSAIAAPGRFYISVPWRTLQAVEAPDRRLWKAALKSGLTASPTLSEEGIIYAVAGRFLYAIQPPGQALPPARSTWPMFQANARHTGRVEK
jgi:outer membrane protein assembly factor BamB